MTISTKITLVPHKSVKDLLAFFRSCSSAIYFDMISLGAEVFFSLPERGVDGESAAGRWPTGGGRSQAANWEGGGFDRSGGGGWRVPSWSPPRWVEGGGRWSPPTSGFASSCLFCTHLAFPLLPRNRRQWILLSVAKGEESPHWDLGSRKKIALTLSARPP